MQVTLTENLADLGNRSVLGHTAPPTPQNMDNGVASTQMPTMQGANLQNFLNQSNFDLDFMDTGGQWIDWQDVFWPQIELPSTLQ